MEEFRDSNASSGIIRYTKSTLEDMISNKSGEIRNDSEELRRSMISEITKNTHNSSLNVRKSAENGLRSLEKKLNFKKDLESLSLNRRSFEHIGSS